MTIGIILLTILGCKDLKTTDTQKKDFGNATERLRFFSSYTGFDSSTKFVFFDSTIVKTAGLEFFYCVKKNHNDYLGNIEDIYIIVRNCETGNYFVNCFPNIWYPHTEHLKVDKEVVKKNVFGDSLSNIHYVAPEIGNYFDDSMPDFKRLYALKDWHTSTTLTEILNGVGYSKKVHGSKERSLSRLTIDSVVRFFISLPQKHDIFGDKVGRLKLCSTKDSSELKTLLHETVRSAELTKKSYNLTKYYLKYYEDFAVAALKNDTDYLVYSGYNALEIGTKCLIVALKPDYLTSAPETRTKSDELRYFFKTKLGNPPIYDVRLYDFCVVWHYEGVE